MAIKKYNVLLDLDETLISAQEYSDFDMTKYQDKIGKWKDKYYVLDDEYIIFERPGLQEFLDFLFKHFNVSVWTAASKSYALFVIEKMILAKKKNRKLEYIFFDYHNHLSKKKYSGPKHLHMLWYDFKLKHYNAKNTLILDDHKQVKKVQPDLVIEARPFDFKNENSEYDRFLYDAKEKIIDHFTLKKNKKIV